MCQKQLMNSTLEVYYFWTQGRLSQIYITIIYYPENLWKNFFDFTFEHWCRLSSESNEITSPPLCRQRTLTPRLQTGNTGYHVVFIIVFRLLWPWKDHWNHFHIWKTLKGTDKYSVNASKSVTTWTFASLVCLCNARGLMCLWYRLHGTLFMR